MAALTAAVGGLVFALVGPSSTLLQPAVAAVNTQVLTVGTNALGQLGSGNTTSRTSVGPVVGISDVVEVHSGRDHVAARTSTGQIYTWGSNQYGALGLGSGVGNQTTPQLVPGLSGVLQITSGHNHTMALASDHTVWTWGLNAAGQIGDGTLTNRFTPFHLTSLTNVAFVAGGRDMSYAVKTDGTVWAWGNNTYGQLGDGTTTNRRTPVQVQGINDVVSVAGGRDHVLALKSDGTVWAWGWNAYGQLGDGTLTNRSRPVQITTGVAQVVAGAHHSYALKTDGSVIAWGRNYHAEIGDGTLTNRTRPVSVTSAPGVPVTGAVSIGSGRDNGVAVLADGRLMAWGENLDGQLGDGTSTNKTRAFFMPGVSGATEANGGSGHTVILENTGPPPPNQPPVASFSSTCSGLTCTFDATKSTDPDGTIHSYEWDFGDTQTDSGRTVSHTFPSASTYSVQLTVTDDDTETDSVTNDVVVTDPPPSQVAFRAAAATNTNVAKPSVRVPASVSAGDVLVLVMTTNRNATTTTPSGWTLRQTILDGTDLRSWVFTRTATAGLANTTVGVTLDAISKTSMAIAAYSGASAVTAVAGATEPGTSATHSSPSVGITGSDGWVTSYWADKTSGHTAWVIPSTMNRRLDSNGSSSGQIDAVLADVGPVSGTWPGATATSGVSTSKAVAWSIVVE